MDTAGTCVGRRGVEAGVLERVMNAGGMLQECRMGLFRGGLLNEGRCGPGGNHRIIIPPLLTFFCPARTHTHTHTAFHRSRHTFQRNILRGTTDEGRKFKGKFNPQLRSAGLPPTCTDGFIYFLQGFMFASLKLLPAAASWLEVKCYKIKYRVGNTPLKQRRTMSDPGAQLYILLLPFTPISTLSPGHPHLFPLCCAYTAGLVSRPFFFFFTKS